MPHSLVKQKLELRVTATTVECFFKGKRVASHVRAAKRGRHTTVLELPLHHITGGRPDGERPVQLELLSAIFPTATSISSPSGSMSVNASASDRGPARLV